MSQNHTITVDQHGALDLRTYHEVPIDYKLNKDNKETSESQYEIGKTSGKLAEDFNRPVNSNSSRLLGKRSFPTLNDGNSSYASMNLDNASETSNVSQHSKGPNCQIPHGSKLDGIMNAEDATHGNMLQKLENLSSSSNRPNCFNSSVLSSSKLLKQSDSTVLNDSSYSPSKNPLFALENLKSQYTCRTKSGNLVESSNKPIYSYMSGSSRFLGKKSFPTLNDSPPYTSMNACDISDTLKYMMNVGGYPYCKLLPTFEKFPRRSEGPSYFNSGVLSSSELLGKRDWTTMNDSCHAQSKSPLVELQSLCGSKEISSGSIQFAQHVKKGYFFWF